MPDPLPFQFLNPLWLFSLPVAWWFVWRFFRLDQNQSSWDQLCDPALLRRMLQGQPRENSARLLRNLVIALLTLGIFAAAGPSWRLQSQPLMESASARVLVLDLSRAMLVEDVRPNRYSQARRAARVLLGAGFDGETGLVVFAANAFVVSPLSRDANTLLAFIAALEPDVMPQDGNRLDLAIQKAQELLEASIAGRGQILILTAGVSTNEDAVPVATAAAGQGNQVSVIAVGSIAGGPMRDTKGGLLRDQQGTVRISRPNQLLMQRIVAAGRGFMVNVEDIAGAESILDLDSDMTSEARRVLDNTQREPANDGIWLLLLMLPLALILFKRNLVWMLALLIMIPGERELYADDRPSSWTHPEKIAFQAYMRKDYETALALSNDPLLQGSAAYRLGRFQQADDFYGKDDSTVAIFNRGNALARQERIPEAIANYAKVLSLDPEFAPALRNKQLLERYLARQNPNEPGQSGEPDNGSTVLQDSERAETETRIGIVGEGSTNPGDDPELGPGLGASRQGGQVDPFERFDGQEQETGRFVLSAQDASLLEENEFIKSWIKSLPDTSTDLFRRKFLRDYNRQKRQPR